MRASNLVPLFLLVLAGIAPASAEEDQTRTAISETELQKLVQDAGYQALIESDENGPYVKSAANGVTFYIGLYDCDEATPAQCTVLSFITDSLGPGDDKAKEKALTWNNGVAWGMWSRVTLDAEGRPGLIYNVSVNGGVRDSFIRVVLQDFVTDISDFQKVMAE